MRWPIRLGSILPAAAAFQFTPRPMPVKKGIRVNGPNSHQAHHRKTSIAIQIRFKTGSRAAVGPSLGILARPYYRGTFTCEFPRAALGFGDDLRLAPPSPCLLLSAGRG